MGLKRGVELLLAPPLNALQNLSSRREGREQDKWKRPKAEIIGSYVDLYAAATSTKHQGEAVSHKIEKLRAKTKGGVNPSDAEWIKLFELESERLQLKKSFLEFCGKMCEIDRRFPRGRMRRRLDAATGILRTGFPGDAADQDILDAARRCAWE